ncbi:MULTISPECIES: DUF6501 family protein [unclassified Gemella]|uniref:DUF6501 family protein n=1 Tax=unclassified Gemella TaxID=2624949 RepID=UPI001C0520FD|nr:MULTISPECIES: DUF6501 family protein [unclassified Gemella]MBU0278315.1 hypothetical protein [Gemella sp. zg-1178]QWQ38180.1 hypothetical protein KMP11_04220 [Gemella sp. zg-570]
MKKVRVTNTNAEKFTVSNVLTVGKEYEVVNETGEYIFVKDNTEEIAGFYKDYFEEIK